MCVYKVSNFYFNAQKILPLALSSLEQLKILNIESKLPLQRLRL